jgi:hypothetical protein
MIPDNFYGDNTRWFIATVVNGIDPEGAGRVQIRIHGIHSADKGDIPEHALPWATSLLPSTEGGTSGLTKIPKLQKSAVVIGIFLDGKSSQAPLIIGTTHQLERPSTVQIQEAIRSDNWETVAPGTSAPGGVYTPRTAITEYDNANGDIAKLRLICMKWLVANDYTAIQAASIVGNLEAESNFVTYAEGDEDRGGSYGIAQWNDLEASGYRGKKMKAYADKRGRDWKTDIFVQLEYLNLELRGPKLNDGSGSGSHSYVWGSLKNAKTFEGGISDFNGTWIFLSKFEVPEFMEKKLPQRERYARKAYEQYISALQAGDAEDNGA